MIDAFTHLDLTCAQPLADMQGRMLSAGVDIALAVETWNGENARWLRQILAQRSPRFRVVPCFRPDEQQPRPEMLRHSEVVGLRVKTADLNRLGDLATWLVTSKRWLVPHAEDGIGPLSRELLALVGRAPGLQIYLPHFGWPRQAKQDDPEWEGAVAALRAVPGMIVGISALPHFSREEFPHTDLQPFATRLTELFGPASVVTASDYPLIDKERYTDYMQLAHAWISGADTPLRPQFEQEPGEKDQR